MASLQIPSVFISPFLAPSIAVLLLGVPALGAQVRLAPQWSENASYLNDYELLQYSQSTRALNSVMDENTAKRLRQSYQDQFRDYEMRQRFGLTDLQAEKKHSSQMNEFGRQALNEVRREQVSIRAKEMRKNFESNPAFDGVRDPLAVAFLMAGIYTGQAITMGDHDFGFRARADIPDQKGQFKLFSPVFESTLEVAADVPNHSSASASPVPLVVADRKERYRLSVSRDLPLLDLSSALSYGSTTSTVNATLTKPLMPNLKAEIGASRSSREQELSEETLRLIYDLRF